MSNLTGWERDKRTHFDDIVADYDKIRPEYPRELFDDVIAYCGQSKNKKTIEIGAGTGKATTTLYKEVKQAILYNGNLYKENMVFQLYMGRK